MTPNTMYVGGEVSDLSRDSGGLGGTYLIADGIERDRTDVVWLATGSCCL
jgi:hypothetical protein